MKAGSGFPLSLDISRSAVLDPGQNGPCCVDAVAVARRGQTSVETSVSQRTVTTSNPRRGDCSRTTTVHTRATPAARMIAVQTSMRQDQPAWRATANRAAVRAGPAGLASWVRMPSIWPASISAAAVVVVVSTHSIGPAVTQR